MLPAQQELRVLQVQQELRVLQVQQELRVPQAQQELRVPQAQRASQAKQEQPVQDFQPAASITAIICIGALWAPVLDNGSSATMQFL